MTNEESENTATQYSRKLDPEQATCDYAGWLWVIAGLVYIIWTGKLLSLPTLFLFFPGVFIGAFIGWIGYLVFDKIAKSMEARERRGEAVSIRRQLAVVAVWHAVSVVAAPICLAILYVRLVRWVLAIM